MKNDTPKERRVKKQLISGCIYVALSAVIVAVSVNTVVSLLSKRVEDLPVLPENINTNLPKIESFDFGTSFYSSLHEQNNLGPDENADISASDTVEGVDAATTEPQNDVLPILSSDTYVGFENYIKPCDGFVIKEHSVDIPVYSETLYDYRIHVGVDIACAKGEPVKACLGGVVEEVYTDNMLGTTVSIKTKGGYTVKYSNLSPELDANITAGTIVETGYIIGGIGETALSEAAEAPHLHLEIYDEQNSPVNPVDLIEF